MQNRSSKPKRPAVFNARAFQTVAILTGTAPEPDPVKAAAALLGR